MRGDELSSPLVTLDVAVQIEKSGRNFYRRAAATASDGGGRVLFAFLADSESNHLQSLKAHRQSLSRDARRSPSQAAEETRRTPVEEGLPLYLRLSLGEIATTYVRDLLYLRIGLMIEDAAEAFYARAAERSERKEDKSLYQKLLGMEEEHHRILEEEYSGLARHFSRVLGFEPF
jgi:rubrerythrin